jgi:ubiquinone/menaquinone biosynthesis C-methylase UbiE
LSTNIKLQEFTDDKDNLQITEFGIKANSIDINLIPHHEKPDQIRDEIPTLNKFGYMKFEWDEFCREFVEHAKLNNDPVLEIGPAYGWVTHRALEEGITIIAADISKQHLEVLLKDAPQDKLDNLYIYHGSFPDEIELPRESLGAVLASRILHFLEGEEIEKGLDKIHSWLKPQGKFFCSNCSIHHYSVNEKMLSIYKETQ